MSVSSNSMKTTSIVCTDLTWKYLPGNMLSKSVFVLLYVQVKLLSQLRHPFIVSYKESFLQEVFYFLAKILP